MCVCVCVFQLKVCWFVRIPPSLLLMVKFGATTGSLLYCRLSQPKIKIS